ncbi:NYN domain-containing protein [Terracidiphilus gabretensis]|uniref:NYN domain-containing protein n=1 Tax=Terracidiphilus gabretensis TaxID=1577687 RepID=UPI00071B4036|nr:NYN domain-containing protein [Terracidiphilus gabretensis]
MPGKCVVVVDNSNIFIEGLKYSAKSKGREGDQDPSWRIDFGRLLKQLARDREIHAAILVGSTPPNSDTVWEEAKRNGFKVTVHERDAQNKEKAVDTELVAQGTRTIVKASQPMVLVLLLVIETSFRSLISPMRKDGLLKWLLLLRRSIPQD